MKNISKQKMAIALGNKIREERLALGLTQKELAERCGMLETNLGAIERGVNSPSLVTLIRISDALDLEIEVLFNSFRDCIKDSFEESNSKEITLLKKIGFKVIDADDEYIITFNSQNPFRILYSQDVLNKIISDITRECEKAKLKAIEEKICAKIFEDFLNEPYDLRALGNLSNMTEDTAKLILDFVEMRKEPPGY